MEIEPLTDNDFRVLASIADPSSGQEMEATSPSYAFNRSYDQTSVVTVTWDQLYAMHDIGDDTVGDSVARLIHNDYIAVGKAPVGLTARLFGKRPITHFFVTSAGRQHLTDTSQHARAAS